MQAAKDLIGKTVISISDGRRLGTVKDVYLDHALESVAGLFLGPEGFLSRNAQVIQRSDVMVFGIDAILAKGSKVVSQGTKTSESAKWIRRDQLQGHRVATAGGTRVGTIDDVLLSDDMRVIGLSLSYVSIEGPVAENRAISREAMLGLDIEEVVMIIDLDKAERQTLQVK